MAFDIVDHLILTEGLKYWLGKNISVAIGNHGPLLFPIYILPSGKAFQKHYIHFNTDNSHIYFSFSQTEK